MGFGSPYTSRVEVVASHSRIIRRGAPTQVDYGRGIILALQCGRNIWFHYL